MSVIYLALRHIHLNVIWTTQEIRYDIIKKTGKFISYYNLYLTRQIYLGIDVYYKVGSLRVLAGKRPGVHMTPCDIHAVLFTFITRQAF